MQGCAGRALCRGIDLPLLLRQRNVQRSIRACLFSARALQSLLRHLHVLGQVIAVAAFMRLPTHTAARLVQAALDCVPRLPVPPAVCAAELSSLRLRHAYTPTCLNFMFGSLASRTTTTSSFKLCKLVGCSSPLVV